MSDDLTDYESAARLYCEAKGLDTNEICSSEWLSNVPRWEHFAHELRDLQLRMWCLRRCGHGVS